MKKLIVIALCILPLLTMAQFAPYIPTSKSNPYYEDSVSIAKKQMEQKQRNINRIAKGQMPETGGYYLQKASGSFSTSLLLAFTGAFAAGYGSYLETQKLDPKETRADSQPYYIAGGILGLASTVFYIRGISLIGKAGEAFDANEKGNTALYLEPRTNGAALVLKF